MTRNTLRGLGLLLPFALVIPITAGAAQARPKKQKRPVARLSAAGGQRLVGGGMTFEPEEVHKDEPRRAAGRRRR